MVKKKEKLDEYKIGEEVEKELEKLQKKSNGKLNLAELYEQEIKRLTELKVAGNMEKLALNKVRNEIRRETRRSEYQPKAKAIPFKGFIIGDSGMWDKAEAIRQAAKRFIEKNGLEAALEQNLIDSENRILDTRAKVYGRDNPDYMKPLKETLHLRTRTLHMIVTSNGVDYKYASMQTNDNKLALGWGKVRLYTPCTTFGIVKEELQDTFILNSSQNEQEGTVSVFKALQEDMDIDKIFLQVVTPRLTTIPDVDSVHEATKDAWDRMIFTKGIVSWINRDRPTAWGTISMGLMDEQGNEVRVNVPAHIDIDFGEQSEIIIFGKTRRTKRKDDETEKLVDADIVIEVVGIYPLKGLVTPAETSTPEQEAEEIIEGWLQ